MPDTQNNSNTTANLRELGPKADLCWKLSIFLYIVLVGSILSDHFIVTPPQVDSPLLFAFVSLAPLLMFIPALVTKHGRGFAWMGFVLLFYFSSGVINGWVKESWLGWLQAGSSLALFTTSIFFVRWYFQKR